MDDDLDADGEEYQAQENAVICASCGHPKGEHNHESWECEHEGCKCVDFS